MRVQLVGVEQAVANLAALPRKVAFKHLRIALNAAGGKIRDAAKILAPTQTGTLKSSLRVKVRIPDASFNIKHHGKPAYVVIGPGRGIIKQVAFDRGRLKRVSGKSLEKAHAFGNRVGVRKPSRYAHLVEFGHGGRRKARAYPFMRPAARIAGPRATKRMADKLAKAFETEAAALPK